MMLLFVLIGYRLDIMIGKDYIRDAMIIGFVTNEMISIVENAGLMGVKLPPIVVSAIDILQKKVDEADKGGENDG
jgi:toxin secretion/phage lysis holin